MCLRDRHGEQRLVQGLGDLLHGGLGRLADGAARMHVVHLMGRLFHAAKVLGQHHEREVARLLLVRSGVQRVGRMRENARDAVVGRVGGVGRDVGGIDLLRTATARVAREELERCV